VAPAKAHTGLEDIQLDFSAMSNNSKGTEKKKKRKRKDSLEVPEGKPKI
jgi:hypothetical protein